MRTDEDLMLAYVEGDARAMDELYRRYRPLLLASFARRCASVADAEDVVQQTFLRVHLARGTYRAGEAVRPWLFTIAHNLRKDAARSAARRPEQHAETDHVPSSADTARPIEQRQTVAIVRAALRRLTPALRSTVELHWLEDRAFDEVARISGIRQGTIRVRAHRACAALREILVGLDRELLEIA